MKVKGTIEKGSDGLYSVYSDDHIGKYYFGGFGLSEEEALADFKESIIEAFEANLEIELSKKQDCKSEDERLITHPSMQKIDLVKALELIDEEQYLEPYREYEREVDLENEIDAYYKEWDGNCRYAQTARHFAEWGAEHLAGDSKMISEDLEKKTFDDYLKASPAERRKMNMAEILGEERLAKTKEQMDLEEAANQYVGYPPEIDEGVVTVSRRAAFKAGAEWQKAKMMEKEDEK